MLENSVLLRKRNGKVVKIKEKTKQLQDLVVQGMLEKKASEITILDLTGVKGSVADYFILCSASSDTQVDAISDSVEKEVYKECAQVPWKSEGKQNKEWILLDYVNVVAHIFKKEKREFYRLEELWGDAKVTTIESV